MFKSPFENRIAFVELELSSYDPSALTDAERRIIARASEKRVKEFTLGRTAAKSAIAKLLKLNEPEQQNLSLLSGPQREPLWPAGVVGSITHSVDFAIAAVGRAAEFRGIGVDVQTTERAMSERLKQRICSAEELSHATTDEAVLKLFSAKETYFKLYYPLCKKFIGFKDVCITPGTTAERLSAKLLVALSAEFKPGHITEIRCSESGGYVLTAAALVAGR